MHAVRNEAMVTVALSYLLIALLMSRALSWSDVALIDAVSASC